MEHTVTLSAQAYSTLERQARTSGKTVEQWLEDEIVRIDSDERRALFDRINAHREEMHQLYGEQPDSTLLIREDRDR